MHKTWISSRNEWFKLCHRRGNQLFFLLLFVMMFAFSLMYYFGEGRAMVQTQERSDLAERRDLLAASIEKQVEENPESKVYYEKTLEVYNAILEAKLPEQEDLIDLATRSLIQFELPRSQAALTQGWESFWSTVMGELPQVKLPSEMTEEERQIQVSSAQVLAQLLQGKSNEEIQALGSLYEAIHRLENLELSLKTKVYQGGLPTKILSGVQLTNELEQKVIIERDRLRTSINENLFFRNQEVMVRARATKNMMQVGFFLLPLFMIYLAATTFATEFQKQTVKSLIMQPLRRRHVVWGKALSLLAMATLLSCFIVLFSYTFSGVLYGFHSSSTVQYFFGRFVLLPDLALYFLRGLSQLLDVLCYTVLAFCLSSFTHNAAFSSIFCFMAVLGSTLILPFLEHFTWLGGTYWSHIFPYIHMDLQYRLLDTGSSFYELLSKPYFIIGFKPRLGESALYLILAFVSFFWMAMDQFTRKDIK